MTSPEQKSYGFPTEVYLANQKSKAIRNVCVPLMNTLDRLAYDPALRSDTVAQQELAGHAETFLKALDVLGISPNMHDDQPDEVFKENPVILAEQIASYYVYMFADGVDVKHESLMARIYSEFSDFRSGNMLAIPNENGNLPPVINRFVKLATILNVSYDWFDVKRPIYGVSR